MTLLVIYCQITHFKMPAESPNACVREIGHAKVRTSQTKTFVSPFSRAVSGTSPEKRKFIQKNYYYYTIGVVLEIVYESH